MSKLSSKKEKHQLDLRVLALKLDRDVARRRLLTDGKAFLDDPKLKPQIEENWRFIFREPLFTDEPQPATRQDSHTVSRTDTMSALENGAIVRFPS